MKKLPLIFTVFLIAISIPITVFAHPGSTDGRGGHYDRSTGDYHFHHGYPAHDHYDMDGDGIDDCPYSFVDKTDTSNRGTSKSDNQESNVNYTKIVPGQLDNPAGEEPSTDNRKDKKEILFSILFVIGFNILGYFTFWKSEVSWSCLYKLIWIGLVFFSVPLVIWLLINFLFA